MTTPVTTLPADVLLPLTHAVTDTRLIVGGKPLTPEELMIRITRAWIKEKLHDIPGRLLELEATTTDQAPLAQEVRELIKQASEALESASVALADQRELFLRQKETIEQRTK